MSDEFVVTELRPSQVEAIRRSLENSGRTELAAIAIGQLQAALSAERARAEAAEQRASQPQRDNWSRDQVRSLRRKVRNLRREIATAAKYRALRQAAWWKELGRLRERGYAHPNYERARTAERERDQIRAQRDAAVAALAAEQEWLERHEAQINSNGVSFADWRAERWEIDRLMMRAQEMRRAILQAADQRRDQGRRLTLASPRAAAVAAPNSASSLTTCCGLVAGLVLATWWR